MLLCPALTKKWKMNMFGVMAHWKDSLVVFELM